MKDNIYSTPEAVLDVSTDKSDEKKAGLGLKVAITVFTLLSGSLGFMTQSVKSGSVAEGIGGALGTVIWSLLIVGLFQIGAGFRNQRSRYKIFMWCQVVFFVSLMFGILSAVGPSMAQ